MAIPSTGFTFPPANNTDFITEIYIGYYNRAPDPAGMNFWLNALAGGETLTQVANQFANSSESIAIYPFLTLPNLVNAGSFVTQVYNNILNRAPDAPGLAFWTAELQSGAVTPGSFILTLEASVNMQTGTADALTLAAKGTVAEDYVLRVATAGVPFTQASAHAALAPVSGIGNSPATPTEVTAGEAITTAYINNPVSNTIILTTGIDAPTINGNNNTVLGVVGGLTATYTPGDTLIANAGSTNNIISLSDAGVGGNANISAVATTVSNFNTLIVNSGEGVTINTATSPSGFTGLTTLNVTSNTPTGGVFQDVVTAAATTNITVTDTATKSGSGGGNTLTVNGGLAVTVTETNTDSGASLTLAPISIGATTAAAGAVVVNNTDTMTGASTSAAITVKGAAGVTVNDTVNYGAGSATGAINVTGGAAAIVVNEVSNFTVGGLGQVVGAITTTGGSTVAITELATQAQTVTGAGAQSSMGEGAVAVNGGTATTAVTVTQANVAAGSGAVAASAGTTFVQGVAAVAASPGVQAVAAVTGVAFAAPVTAVVGTPTVAFDGVVTIADKTNTSTATSTITTVSLSGYSNSAFTGAALNSLSLAGTGGTLNIANGAAAAATNTTLALALNGLTDTGAGAANNTITDANAEITTLNITAGATKSSLDGFIDANLKAVTIAGSSVVTLGGNFNFGNDAGLKTIAVSGAAGLTSANLAGFGANLALTTTSSGVITATLDDTTQTFIGSTGQDIISLAGDATKAITGGSATNNEVVLTNANAATYTAAKFGTNVTGFTILGVNDGNNATNTYDLHNIFKGYTAIDLQSSNDTATFTGVTAGTTLGIDANEAAVSYVLFTPSNTSTVSLSLGLASNAGNINVGTLTLNDSNADGVATANIISNAKAATSGVTNSISNFNDTSLSTLNISGNAALSINGTILLGQPGLAVPVGVAALTINNTSAAFNTPTNSLIGSSIFGITDDTLGSLTFGGTNGMTIGTVTDNNAVNLTINSTDTAAATINLLTTDGNAADVINNGLSNLTFTGSGVVNILSETMVIGTNNVPLVITNSGTATDSIVAMTDFTGFSQTPSLTVTGNVALGVNGATVAADAAGAIIFGKSGFTFSAATDNAHISIFLTGAVATNTDTVTVGNGNDYIADGSTAGLVNVTVGTGQNYIDLHTGSAATYLAQVTLGAHAAPDWILTGGVAAAAAQANTIITGAAAGDFITVKDGGILAVQTLSAGTLTTIGNAATLASAISTADTGLLSHNAAMFTYSGNTYLIENSTGATEAGTLAAGDTIVQLVGTHTLSTTITAGHLTLLS